MCKPKTFFLVLKAEIVKQSLQFSSILDTAVSRLEALAFIHENESNRIYLLIGELFDRFVKTIDDYRDIDMWMNSNISSIQIGKFDILYGR